MGGSVAIANAVYHATAKQVRDLRITVKKLLLHGYCPQRSDSHLARSSMSEMTGFGADAANGDINRERPKSTRPSHWPVRPSPAA
jgi:hypothetical protein